MAGVESSEPMIPALLEEEKERAEPVLREEEPQEAWEGAAARTVVLPETVQSPAPKTASGLWSWPFFL